ncbi:MAG: SusC/RagA family TonB-linked outer membrane protein [Bacteroidales bacterium]|nr:SusC/RagA family TonB-linked outer membrane protein [Bacteroidales bacterium]
MNRILKTFVLLVAMCAAMPAFAAVPVKGTIKDGNNAPIPGATVVEVGTTNGQVADADGKYTINVASANAVLQFSCIGYETVEIELNGRATLDVVLNEEASFLEETVVIGYGSQKKADITSSVQSVKSDDFNKGAVLDAGQLIQGKVAGLQITISSGDPTASSSMSLRGLSSLYGSTAPLVLVDGVPGNLDTVAPEDIESIDILKDGSATAIYGTRGTNGVIIITTKNAKREMPATVEYAGYVSLSDWLKTPDFMDAADLRAKIKEGWIFGGANETDMGATTDWLKEISQIGVSHNHNLSIMGGSRNNTYTANVTYRDNEGTIKGTGRTNLRARAQVSQYLLDNKLKLTGEILASESESNTGFSPTYVYRMACIQNPTQPIYNEDGTYCERAIYNYDNPIGMMLERDGMYRNRSIRFNGVAEFKPIEQLTFKALYVRKGQNTISGYYTSRLDASTTEGGTNGSASRSASDYIYNMAELSANYVQDFGDHHITAIAGYSYEDNVSENFSASNWDFPTDAYGYNALEMGNALKEGNASMSSYKSKTKLIGLFARATYNYADRYLLMVSYRRDGSSKFGADHKWGNFPGVSLGWNLHNESWMKSASWLNQLKLRAGYGITGIDVSSPYQSLASLNYEGSYMYAGEWIQTLVPARNDNPNLRWEKKYEYNIGLDFAILDERLSGSIDLYQRDTKDGLYYYSVPTPPYQYGTIMANVCHLQNKGVEVLINAVPVRTRDFEWTSSVSFSYNANKLVSLQNDEFQTSSDWFSAGHTGEPIQTTTHRVKEGWPIGNLFGLKSIGVDDDGKWVVERLRYDAEGNVESKYYDYAANAGQNDWQVLGNGVPDFFANFNNTFRYKNFDLNITMRGAFGHQILNYQKMYYGNPTILYNVLNCAFDKFDAVDAKTGQLTGNKAVLSDSQRYVSYYVENGDYWKIDNVTLGYTKRFKSDIIKKVRAYVTVNNLATITGYTGLDPEVSFGGFDPGTDSRDKYPTIRAYTFGVNLTF